MAAQTQELGPLTSAEAVPVGHWGRGIMVVSCEMDKIQESKHELKTTVSRKMAERVGGAGSGKGQQVCRSQWRQRREGKPDGVMASARINTRQRPRPLAQVARHLTLAPQC